MAEITHDSIRNPSPKPEISYVYQMPDGEGSQLVKSDSSAFFMPEEDLEILLTTKSKDILKKDSIENEFLENQADHEVASAAINLKKDE